MLRYNAENDMVQIFFNGQWNDWRSGGFQTVNFLKYKETDWNFTVSAATKAYEVDSSGYICFYATPTTSNAGGSVIATTDNYIDFTSKTKLSFNGEIFLYTTAKSWINIISEEGKTVASWTSPAPGSSAAGFSGTIDVSGITGKCRVQITLPCYGGYTRTWFWFKRFTLE